jgi:hypothetical protein
MSASFDTSEPARLDPEWANLFPPSRPYDDGAESDREDGSQALARSPGTHDQPSRGATSRRRALRIAANGPVWTALLSVALLVAAVTAMVVISASRTTGAPSAERPAVRTSRPQTPTGAPHAAQRDIPAARRPRSTKRHRRHSHRARSEARKPPRRTPAASTARPGTARGRSTPPQPFAAPRAPRGPRRPAPVPAGAPPEFM